MMELNDGVPQRSERKDDWLMFSCPLAEWKHAGGQDNNPSFGILITDARESLFHCFGCKAKGPLPYLIHLLEEHSGEDYTDLEDEIEAAETVGYDLPDWSRRKHGEEIQKLPDPLSEEYWHVYDSAEGHPYLRRRHISARTARRIPILHDPDEDRILFPMCDHAGALYGFTGRAVSSKRIPRVKDYFGLPKRLCLLGDHLVDRKSDEPVLLVEGLFDFARLVTLGFDALASCGSDLTEPQRKILQRIGRPVYLFYDNDMAGKDGAALAAAALRASLPVAKVRYPKGVSDPGEIHSAEHVRKMIKNARLA